MLSHYIFPSPRMKEKEMVYQVEVEEAEEKKQWLATYPRESLKVVVPITAARALQILIPAPVAIQEASARIQHLAALECLGSVEILLLI